MADISEDTSVDPNVDYEAGLADGTTSPSDVPATDIDTSATPVDPAVDPQAGSGENPAVPTSEIDTSASPVPILKAGTYDAEGNPVNISPDGTITRVNADGNVISKSSTSQDPLSAAITAATGVANGGSFTGALFNLNSTPGAIASAIQGLTGSAQKQQTFSDQNRQINQNDWRVKLSLAPQSKYLYNSQPAGSAGILEPLRGTNGVIFPYTPAISTAYRANYSPYDLTHSNYRGYWYQNSFTDTISINAPFTAQNTTEANYLLAVIQFFRSVTKMFYGQDAERGSPPPVVYLSGLGEYQFNNHACLVTNFNYVLPADVDYIRAGSTNNLQLNQDLARPKTGVSINSNFGSLQRLATAILSNGNPVSQGAKPTAPPPANQLNSPTYVPTKIEIQLQLIPVQSRQQVSSQFSLKGFASGDLLKKGFW